MQHNIINRIMSILSAAKTDTQNPSSVFSSFLFQHTVILQLAAKQKKKKTKHHVAMSSSSAAPPSAFVATANEHLSRLQQVYHHALSSHDHPALLRSIRHARIIQHAVLLHRAVLDILDLPPSPQTAHARPYFQHALPRVEAALIDSDFDTLSALSSSLTLLLDAVASESPPATFEPIAPSFDQSSIDLALPLSTTDHPSSNPHPRGKRRQQPAALCKSFSALSKRQKLIFMLYVFVVIAAFAAVAVITMEFVGQAIDPPGAIRAIPEDDGLAAPVVTVCLSQPGVPFSRLQMFNFTDASGKTFKGADPRGPQDERASPEFQQVVERFWDNPDNEECNATVGDFFPFPLVSLQRIANRQKMTRCRQCYRVGLRRTVVASSTSFQNSSILSLFTDNYFLQCTRTVGGLNDESLKFLHGQLFEKREDMERLEVLSTTVPGDSNRVGNLDEAAFANVTAQQACNIFYFSFFPKALNRTDNSVDITYAYNGTAWNPDGRGPYFQVLNETTEFLPAESLQMYVEGNSTARKNHLRNDTDVILIGPNTQTYATLRRVIVFETERYDISSSTSNIFQGDITPIFGYWLVYRIYYNFNRFVTDEWSREPTYKAPQWIVDVLGYLSLFTGISIFSLVLLPILRAMRRRDKSRLLQNRPEGYVWAKHKRIAENKLGSGIGNNSSELGGGAELPTSSTGGNLLLPGYNA